MKYYIIVTEITFKEQKIDEFRFFVEGHNIIDAFNEMLKDEDVISGKIKICKIINILNSTASFKVN